MSRILYFLVCGIFISSVNLYRLPSSIIPKHYKLQILSYLGEPKNFNYEGNVRIQVTCIKPTQNITLHSKGLNITTGEITVKDTTSSKPNCLQVKNVEFDISNDFLIINLKELLQKDHNYEVYIPFEAELSDGLNGFYRSSYVDNTTKEKRWLGLTQFEAINARRAFPCFDEPAMKAVFDITIGRKGTYSSISNMPLVQSEPIKEKDGYFWDKFAPSVPMSTYLVAFVVSDFHYKSAEPCQHNNVTFRIWAKRDSLNQVDYAKEVGPKALSYFEDFFDIKYPLPKEDMIAIPDFSAGAMENWGLITYREAILLFNPKLSSLSNQHRIANVIAHELAHQWFGNLVTMKWWTDLWLNEGFATYMASRAVEHLYPEWKSFEEDAVNNLLNVFSFDSLKSSHPVSVPIGHPDEINEIFDTISYKKGSFLLRMISLVLGDETFKFGVSNYLKKHMFGNAEQDNLWDALTEEAHKNGALPKNLTVKTVMDTWTLQTGYPVITVKRNYDKSTAEITQERFLSDEIKERKGSCWWVPLTYTNANERSFEITKPKSWLSCDDKVKIIDDLPDEKTWVLFNNQLEGLYKINYDERNWKLLSQTLNSPQHDHIPILNKVQLIDDAFELARVDKLKYDIFFDILNYLKHEDEYLPWKAALSKTSVLSRQLKKTGTYGLFKVYMKRILTPIYEKIGGLNVPISKTENKLDIVKHRILVDNWSCEFDVSDCIAEGQELFKKYENNSKDKNIIPKEMRSVIYCTAIKHGGEKEWNFLWEEYKKSDLASEQSTILNALGCTKEIWLLRRYLEWSITPDSGIRKQDSSTVFSTVASNDVGYFIAKDFFQNKIKDIGKYLQNNERRLSRYLSSIAAYTTTEKDYKELQDFVKENEKYLKEVKQGVAQSLETAKLNVQWQTKRRNEVENILRRITEGDKN